MQTELSADGDFVQVGCTVAVGVLVDWGSKTRVAPGVPVSAIDAFFKVGDDSSPSECVIEVYGDIDLDAAERMREVIEAGLAESPDRLVIDLVGVTSIDPSALSMLAAAREHGRSLGTDVVLRSPSATTVARIANAGLGGQLPIVYPNDGRPPRPFPPST